MTNLFNPNTDLTNHEVLPAVAVDRKHGTLTRAIGAVEALQATLDARARLAAEKAARQAAVEAELAKKFALHTQPQVSREPANSTANVPAQRLPQETTPASDAVAVDPMTEMERDAQAALDQIYAAQQPEVRANSDQFGLAA